MRDYRVVLDACVLIPMPLADTLRRTAEAPRLYLPQWSQTIMNEVTRNLIAKWEMAPDKARRREEELRRHFPEAWVEAVRRQVVRTSWSDCKASPVPRRGKMRVCPSMIPLIDAKS